MKTKNVPKVLKCKINHLNQQTIFFLHKHGVPKLGGGGVVLDLGKIPTFSLFFLPTSLMKYFKVEKRESAAERLGLLKNKKKHLDIEEVLIYTSFYVARETNSLKKI